MRVYKTIVAFLNVIIHLFFRVKVIGRENEPKEGALLVCANHISLWDPVFVACALKRQVHFMGKKELFEKPILKQLLPVVGAFPVARNTSDITAVKTALGILRDGKSLGMFIQGTRKSGIDPSLTDIKSGVGMLISHSGAAAIPVAIYTKKNRIAIGRKVTVVIGKTLASDELQNHERSREAYQKMADTLFERICTMSESVEHHSEKGQENL